MTKAQMAARKRELRAMIEAAQPELDAYNAIRAKVAAYERELYDLRAMTTKAKDQPYYEAGRDRIPRNGNW